MQYFTVTVLKHYELHLHYKTGSEVEVSFMSSGPAKPTCLYLPKIENRKSCGYKGFLIHLNKNLSVMINVPWKPYQWHQFTASRCVPLHCFTAVLYKLLCRTWVKSTHSYSDRTYIHLVKSPLDYSCIFICPIIPHSPWETCPCSTLSLDSHHCTWSRWQSRGRAHPPPSHILTGNSGRPNRQIDRR